MDGDYSYMNYISGLTLQELYVEWDEVVKVFNNKKGGDKNEY